MRFESSRFWSPASRAAAGYSRPTCGPGREILHTLSLFAALSACALGFIASGIINLFTLRGKPAYTGDLFQS